MHDPDAIIDKVAVGNQDRRFAVGTTTHREDGVIYGLAAVEWDRGIEAESLRD